MIDSVKISVHAPFLNDGKGNMKRMYNAMFYDILLANSDARKNGFILNSRTGVYTTDTIYQMKVSQFDNYEMLMLNGKINLPSYNYNIYYRIFEERVDIEFSLPKYFYGLVDN